MSESDCGVNVGICTKIEARTSFLFELFFPFDLTCSNSICTSAPAPLPPSIHSCATLNLTHSVQEVASNANGMVVTYDPKCAACAACSRQKVLLFEMGFLYLYMMCERCSTSVCRQLHFGMPIQTRVGTCRPVGVFFLLV